MKKRSRVRRIAPLTDPDKIMQAAYERLKSTRFVPGELDPPGRKIVPGENVSIGNLEDVQVVELRDDGRICLVKFRASKDHRDHGAADDSWQYGAWYWWECLPMPERPGYELSADPDRPSFTQTSFWTLLRRGCRREYFDNPEYQRGYVWKDSDRLRFLDSVMQGVDLGKFVFVTYDWPENRHEILDGKQRLTTAVDFVLGKITYRGFRWWELTCGDRYRFENRLVQYVTLDGSNTKRSDRLKLFLTVNAGGVPQTDEHLHRVRALYEEALRDEATGGK